MTDEETKEETTEEPTTPEEETPSEAKEEKEEAPAEEETPSEVKEEKEDGDEEKQQLQHFIERGKVFQVDPLPLCLKFINMENLFGENIKQKGTKNIKFIRSAY